VMRSGVPHRQTEGLWDNAGQCGGAAGLLELFLGLWSAPGREPYLAFSRTLADHLIARGWDADGRGRRRYRAHRRVSPRAVSPDAGYMVGAAGIGAALLHLDAALRPGCSRRLVLLPDNPSSAIPVPAAALSDG